MQVKLQCNCRTKQEFINREVWYQLQHIQNQQLKSKGIDKFCYVIAASSQFWETVATLGVANLFSLSNTGNADALSIKNRH